jgi:GT2 family glycosyltransferase
LVAFTDDDCYVSKNFFSSCISAFSHGNFDYCGGRILPFDPEDAKYGYNENKTFSIIPPRTLIKAGSLQGANMIFRRSVIDKVGLFDANLGAGTAFRCEDIDYASRASLLGCVGAHVPDIVVFHHHRRKPGEDIERIKRLNDIARGAYYAKRVREGHFRYVQLWAEVARKRRSWPPLRRELKGALKYILNISA